MSKITPLPGFVLVETIEDDVKTDGGLYVPETEKDKPSKGKVVSVGNPFNDFSAGSQILFVSSPVKEGQIVVFKKWTNQEIQDDGKKYLVVAYSELLSVIE